MSPCRTKRATPPLIYAVFRNFGELARQFIEAGADVNAETQEGITALSLACHCGHADCTRLLIESGANVNAMVHGGRFHGMTALKAARENNCTPTHAECIQLLQAAGAVE